jgi:hypothetical protein
MRTSNKILILGFALMSIGILFAVAYGSNSTSTSNMTLDCIRMFYSDSWDKGYVTDLAKYCSTK